MYREVFSSRLKAARKEMDVPQRKVAEETNIPPSTIAKYETGKLEPDLEKLGQLAAFFNKSPGWFIGLT